MGRTSIICTIRIDAENIYETASTLGFAERAQLVETGMTAATFRDAVLDRRIRLLADLQACADVDKARQFANEAETENRDRITRIEKEVNEFGANVESIVKEVETDFFKSQRDMTESHKRDLLLAENDTARLTKEVRDSHEVTFRRYEEKISFAIAAEERTLATRSSSSRKSRRSQSRSVVMVRENSHI